MERQRHGTGSGSARGDAAQYSDPAAQRESGGTAKRIWGGIHHEADTEWQLHPTAKAGGVTIGDGCDDYFGSGGGIKNTVTIVTTVTHPKTHPSSPALNPQIGSRTVDGGGAVREYGNAGVHAAADDVVHRRQRPRLPQEPHSPSESPRYFAAAG